MKLYLVVTIDTECDKGPGWRLQHPIKYTSVTRGIPERLMPLFEPYQIKPTFLLSPEVIRDDDSVKVLSAINNCELGTHLHGEFIPPEELNQSARTQTPQFSYPPEIERQKLANLTELFAIRFGYSPKCFRAGRFGISSRTISFLEELGYQVDSSVTPFWTHSYEGREERNFWGAPVQPYFPSLRDIRELGNSPILEVPVTIINPLLVQWPRWLLKTMSSQTRWHKRILGRLGITLPHTFWLRPQRSSPEELIAVVESTIRASSRSEVVVLNMMYHSVEIIPGASPYAETQAQVQAILDAQSKLFTYLRDNYAMQSVGLSDLKPLIVSEQRANNP